MPNYIYRDSIDKTKYPNGYDDIGREPNSYSLMSERGLEVPADDYYSDELANKYGLPEWGLQPFTPRITLDEMEDGLRSAVLVPPETLPDDDIVILGPSKNHQPSAKVSYRGHRRNVPPAATAYQEKYEHSARQIPSSPTLDAEQEPDDLQLSNDGYRTVQDPRLRGLNAEVRRRIGRGESAGKIASFVDHIAPGRGKDLLLDLLETVKFRKDNEKVPMKYYKIDLERMNVPLTPVENLRNRAAQSAAGAFVTGSADAITAGTLDNMTSDPELTRRGMNQVAQRHPVANLAGQAYGAILTAPLVEAKVAAPALRMVNAGRKLRPKGAAPVLGDVIYGGAYGAGSQDDNRLEGALIGATAGGIVRPVGKGLARPVREMRAQSKFESGMEKYLAQGFDLDTALYLTTPYEKMGHHFIPRNREAFIFNKVIKLPDNVVNSEFNVLRPKGMSIGDFYELHYKVDPSFHGAGLPGKGRGGGWSGKRLGLKKYGRVGRLWHGSPAPLKGLLAGPIVEGAFLYGGSGHDSEEELSPMQAVR